MIKVTGHVKIKAWEIDSNQTLTLEIEFESLKMRHAYYRIKEEGKWRWRLMSAAGTPTAIFHGDHNILNECVLDHDFLSKIAPLWDIFPPES